MNINDVIEHKNSFTKWIITSKENNNYSIYRYYNDCIDYNSNIILNNNKLNKYFNFYYKTK